MRDFERMKTSLLLTCCETRVTPKTFWVFQITKTSRGFEVRNSHELVESLLNAKLVEPLGRRASVKEVTSAIPLQGRDYSHSSWEAHIHGTLGS